MSRAISQREAKRLRKRVQMLSEAEDRRRRRWGQEWLGGVEIARAQWEPTGSIPVATRTARALGHAVVCVGDETGVVRFIALPLGGVT